MTVYALPYGKFRRDSIPLVRFLRKLSVFTSLRSVPADLVDGGWEFSDKYVLGNGNRFYT